MFLDLRILNELRGRFSEVRILKDLVNSEWWIVNKRQENVHRAACHSGCFRTPRRSGQESGRERTYRKRSP
jgi:hypothetical protein